jgi:hypothetical protein
VKVKSTVSRMCDKESERATLLGRSRFCNTNAIEAVLHLSRVFHLETLQLSSIEFSSQVVTALPGRAITAMSLRGRTSWASKSGVSAKRHQHPTLDQRRSHLRLNDGRCRLAMTSQQPQNASRSPGTPRTIVVTNSGFML